MSKINFTLSIEAQNSLDKIIELNSASSYMEALQYSIGTELFLREQIKNGYVIILDNGKERKKVVLL